MNKSARLCYFYLASLTNIMFLVMENWKVLEMLKIYIHIHYKNENTFTYMRVLTNMLANITDRKMSFYVKKSKYVHLCIQKFCFGDFLSN